MEKMKKVLVMLLVLCMTFSQCTLVQAADKKAPKYAITMNKSVYTMKKGKTVVLKAKLNKSAGKKKVVWSSSSKSVATVSPSGKVTAKKSGRATVTAKIKGTGTKAVCRITVGTPVEKIKLAKSSITIGEGVYYKVNVAFAPKKPSNSKVIYISSDTSVATVTPSGVVKGVNEGSAKITVTAADGTGKNSSCKVLVEPKKEQKPSPDKPDAETPKPDKPDPVAPNPGTPDPVTPNPGTSDPVTPNPGTPDPVTPSTETPSTETPSTEAPSTEVEADSVALDKTAISLSVKQEDTLTASITPVNVTNKEITWKTSGEKIVTVDQSGKVKAIKEGSADITATTANGKTAVCTVTVLAAAPNGTVKNQEELDKALLNEDLTTIIYKTDKADAIEIPAADYTDKTLEIHAPNGDVTNNGKFAKVVIYAIASDTYVENGENTIEFNAAQGHIEVGSTGTASIQMSDKGSQSLHLENNGRVSGLNVPAQTSLNIDGRNEVPITLEAGAEGTDIRTSVELNIDSSTKWEMSILPGGEQTKATVGNDNCIPSVYGLGCIPVTVNDGDRRMVNVPAIMSAELEREINQKVTISGKVQEYTLVGGAPHKDNSAGAGIYLFNCTSSDDFIMDAENAGFVIGSTPRTTTDTSGNYTISDISIGNYWMVIAKGNDYKAAVKMVCITSDYTGAYANSNTTLLPAEFYAAGSTSISGEVIDGLTGNPVKEPFIQVELRAGNGNIVGEVFQKTETDNNGKYVFTNVPAGVYTVHVVDLRQGLPEGTSNYNQANADIVVAPTYLSTNNYDVVINPQMSSGDDHDQVQFTLTWGTAESGASPDIDSHLWGPKSDGSGEFHTVFYDKGYFEADDKMADLDVDDTDFEGPEHTTIYKEADGIYRFYVHNYSEKNNFNSDMLGKSSIQVRVTIGNNNYIYNCPNEQGNVWYVCDYDSVQNKVILKNEVSTCSDEGNVGFRQ